MNARSCIFIALGLLTILRLWLAASIELSPDESYYYLWSQRLDVCYFSKGPGVALAIRLGTALLGASELGVRLLSPLLSLGTSLLVYSFTRRLFSENAALWALVGSSFLPILNVGSVLMTIDPLSIFFWTAALYTFWLALENALQREDQQLGSGWSLWWPLTGALIGMGFLCKWINALQLLSILLILLSSNRFRGHFKQPGFWVMLAVFCVFTVPPVAWNAQHQWVTFSHVSERGGLRSGFSLSLGEPLAFLGAHLGVYSPLLFLAMLATIQREFPRARNHFKPRFLLLFTLPILLLYLCLSLKKAGEANWTAPGMISLLILAAAHWSERAPNSRAARRFLGVGLGFGLLLSVLIMNIDLLRMAGLPYPYRKDPSKRLRGWQAITEAVEGVRQKTEKALGAPVFLIANGRALASSVAFYLKEPRTEGQGHPPVYTPESQAITDQYSFWPRYDEFVELKPGQRPRDPQYTEETGVNPFHGRTALYFTDGSEETAQGAISSAFEKVEMVACFDIDRFGYPLKQIRIFRCDNYRGRPL